MPGIVKIPLVVLAWVVWLGGSARSAGAEKDAAGIHPYPLFPSEPVPGWPGVGAGEDATPEKLGTTVDGLKVPAAYGQPEFLAYPGAVHHEREQIQRYVPPYPVYNQNTLVKNFILHGLEDRGRQCVEWAEPVYYIPMYAPDRVATRQKRPPVRAYPWTPASPPIRMVLGRLKPSLCVVRAIAAAPEVATGEWKDRKYAFIQFRVNDDPADPERMRSYILRAATIDNFYPIQEFYFHARGDRSVVCEMSLHPHTETPLLLYNIDVHDRYGELARKAGKKHTVFFDVEQRRRKWEENRQKAKITELKPRTAEEQGKIDDKTWAGPFPPLNCHIWAYADYYYPFNYGAAAKDPAKDCIRYRDSMCLAPEDWLEDKSPWLEALRPSLQRLTQPHVYVSSEGNAYVYGAKLRDDSPAYEFREGEYWGTLDGKEQRLGAVAECAFKDKSFVAAGKDLGDAGKLGLSIRNVQRFKNGQPDGQLARFSRNQPDYLGRKFFDENAQNACVGEFGFRPGVYYNAYFGGFRGGNWAVSLPPAWTDLGDPNAAHDTALRLVRCAYDWPAIQPSRDLGGIMGSMVLHRQINRRYQWEQQPQMMLVYDSLFDFINGNQEFARAVSRYLPWIKTPQDVIAFLDTVIIQDHANDMLKFRYWFDHQNHVLMLNAVKAQDDVKITRPWMEHLWKRYFEYPQAITGLADQLVTSNGRDGGTTIGSYFYTSGPPAVETAALLEDYIRSGGDKKYDLTDALQYPVSRAAVYLPFEAMAAGRHNPGIGDVGGPSQAYWRCPPGRNIMAAGWRWTGDPKFAWELVNVFGRAEETDEAWLAVTHAAAKCPRDPYLMNRSRALSDWGGYLTAGQESDDFRFKREIVVRVGVGTGHAHQDTLDLRIWAHGVTMSGDMGQRSGYGQPDHSASRVHNLVEVDGASWQSHAWVRNLFDAKGAPYMVAESVPPEHLKHVKLFRRQNALIDVDEGKPSTKTPPQTDPDVVTPSSYVFDVFRVSGGATHTYCYHGVVDDQFTVNVKERRNVTAREGGPDEEYLRSFGWRDRVKDAGPDDVEWAADPSDDTLVATWRLARAPGNDLPEKRMYTCQKPHLGGAMTTPRKHNRLHLFNVTGERILHGVCMDRTITREHNPAKEFYCGRCLFAQKRGNPGDALESAFAAVIELYSGEPFIASAKALTVADNEADALKAVAVEVKTASGHTDLCFADGRPDRLRVVQADGIGEVKVSADYAYLSQDTDGLRQATIAGGKVLSAPGVAIEVQDAQYGGRITAVDYRNRRVTLDGPVPGKRFAGAFFEGGGSFHKSSHEVDAVERAGNTPVLHLRKGIEVMMSMVTRIDPATGVLRTRIAMLRARGNERDLTASNEDCTKFWKLENTGEGNRHEGWEFRLTPVGEAAGATETSSRPAKLSKPIPASAMSAGQTLRVWEFGVGDSFCIRTGVSMRRVGKDTYEVYATSPFAVALAGGSLSASRGGSPLQALKVEASGGKVKAEVGEDVIDAGTFLLYVTR
jgi:hypothetical protein